MTALVCVLGVLLVAFGTAIGGLSALPGYMESQHAADRRLRDGVISGTVVAVVGLALILWMSA